MEKSGQGERALTVKESRGNETLSLHEEWKTTHDMGGTREDRVKWEMRKEKEETKI